MIGPNYLSSPISTNLLTSWEAIGMRVDGSKH